jgi:hypothetical protein
LLCSLMKSNPSECDSLTNPDDGIVMRVAI